jgi:DNA-binding PucR family transcriptional regulator
MAITPRIPPEWVVVAAPDTVEAAIELAEATIAERLPVTAVSVVLVAPGSTDGPAEDGVLDVSLEIGDGRRVVARIGRNGSPADERIREVAETALLTVARAALIERDRRRSQELTRLVATAKRVSTSLEHETVLSAIVHDATSLLQASSGDILIWDRERDVLRVVAVANFPPEMLGYELRFGQGLSSQAIMARRTIQVDDYSTYPNRAIELDEYDFGSVLCAPLLFRGVAIGAINVHLAKSDRQFGSADADLLQAFGGVAAIAIDHARRYENEVGLRQELAATNRDLQRSLSLQRDLAEQVLQGGGPSAVAAELARVLVRPLAIVDHLDRPIAGACPDGGDGWKDLVGARPATRRTGRRGRADAADLDGSTADASVLRVPVHVGTELVGHLVMASEDLPGPLDRALVEIASTGVALEFAKIRAALDVEQRIRGEVVQDLLGGTFTTDEAIEARAARLGYDLSRMRDVLVLEVDGPAASDEAFVQRERLLVDRLTDHLAREAPGSAVAAVGRSIVILAATRDGDGGTTTEGLAAAVRETAARVLDGAAVSIAIGDRCDRPPDFAPSYRLARESLEVMRKLGRSDRVISARELGPYRMLIKATSPDDLHEFAHGTLRPLLEHDAKSGADLVETLRVYLDEGQVQRKTAARLFVHVNTIVYRLHRIEELLGRRLADPRTIFDLTLAMRILDLADPSP